MGYWRECTHSLPICWILPLSYSSHGHKVKVYSGNPFVARGHSSIGHWDTCPLQLQLQIALPPWPNRWFFALNPASARFSHCRPVQPPRATARTSSNWRTPADPGPIQDSAAAAQQSRRPCTVHERVLVLGGTQGRLPQKIGTPGFPVHRRMLQRVSPRRGRRGVCA